MLLVGCAAAGVAEPFIVSPEQCEVPRVALRLEFEPPLLVPGELRCAHECGERRLVRTGCTSVALMLPEGPVALVLLANGRRYELALRVAATMEPVVWSLDH